MKALRTLACVFLHMCLFGIPVAVVFVGIPMVVIARELSLLRLVAVLVAVGALSGCTYRSDAEERRLADSQATMWEAAQAIRIGRDPSGPVQVIQANASACAGALGHPYPPKETP